MRITAKRFPRHYNEGRYTGFRTMRANFQDTADKLLEKEEFKSFDWDFNTGGDDYVEELLETGTMFLTEEEHKDIAYRLLKAKLKGEDTGDNEV